MECVTTPSRIPALMSKVDIIISTLTYTLARDQQIDFSIPYYDATGRLLVRNDTNISSLGALAVRPSSRPRFDLRQAGYAIASKTRGCSSSTQLRRRLWRSEGPRADTFMFDDALLLGIAANDSQLKLTSQKFLNLPWGIGIRQARRR